MHGCLLRLLRHIDAHAGTILPINTGQAASRDHGSEWADPAFREFYNSKLISRTGLLWGSSDSEAHIGGEIHEGQRARFSGGRNIQPTGLKDEKLSEKGFGGLTRGHRGFGGDTQKHIQKSIVKGDLSV